MTMLAKKKTTLFNKKSLINKFMNKLIVLMEVIKIGNMYKTKKKKRRCRGSNPGHPRDRREYSPLYYNDFVERMSSYYSKLLNSHNWLLVDVNCL